jgi:hypothetical protein
LIKRSAEKCDGNRIGKSSQHFFHLFNNLNSIKSVGTSIKMLRKAFLSGFVGYFQFCGNLIKGGLERKKRKAVAL